MHRTVHRMIERRLKQGYRSDAIARELGVSTEDVAGVRRRLFVSTKPKKPRKPRNQNFENYERWVLAMWERCPERRKALLGCFTDECEQMGLSL